MKLIFTGDICITGEFATQLAASKSLFSDKITDQLKNADFVIANLEGAATKFDVLESKNTMLKNPSDAIPYLKSNNIGVFNLANNHILDCGEKGFLETISTINTEKTKYFGATSSSKKHQPLILEKDTIKIALFGIAKCDNTTSGNATFFSSDDFSSLKKEIIKTKENVDYVIVNFHGGEEFTLFPSPVKRKILKKIAKIKEVDIIIAHHSHTFQGVEEVENTPIFYSLGNFIFDIPNHDIYEHTSNSALVEINFTKEKFTYNFTPIRLQNGIVTTSDQQTFKTYLQKISNFENYAKSWQKEAYRILFRANNPKISDEIKNDNSLQNKKMLHLVFLSKFYSKLNRIVKDKVLFSIYKSAIYHKIQLKIAKLF